MARLGTMKLEGTSGTLYRFRIYSWTTSFKPVGAVYFVTRRFEKSGGRFRHQRIYLGQTQDLSEGFEKHTQKESFEQHSANCICVHRENDETQRQQIEQDLRPKHKALCNT
ncbi:MAG: hypothetical protein HZB51_00560 [Chloroflexi bacterium]|nr:hypothetical protein [Chloroflexota bacterium]